MAGLYLTGLRPIKEKNGRKNIIKEKSCHYIMGMKTRLVASLFRNSRRLEEMEERKMVRWRRKRRRSRRRRGKRRGWRTKRKKMRRGWRRSGGRGGGGRGGEEEEDMEKWR